jgi:UDP-galactopyranose mutase
MNLKPYEVSAFLQKEIDKERITDPKNFEGKAISMIGRPLYEAFIRGYTLKQWQKDPKELPAAILNRLPFRTNYNESYFHDRWQGIPEHGYTAIFNKMLDHENIILELNTDFFNIRDSLPKDAILIYTGPIDRFFDYKHGRLEWRSLDFQHEIKEVADYQGTSVMNYAEDRIPYTRIHEPRHLHPERDYPGDRTLTIKEFPTLDDGSAPYYPINNDYNQKMLKKYQQEAAGLPNVFFGGRLGEYEYLDMDQTIERALDLFEHSLLPRLSCRQGGRSLL